MELPVPLVLIQNLNSSLFSTFCLLKCYKQTIFKVNFLPTFTSIFILKEFQYFYHTRQTNRWELVQTEVHD